MRDGAGRNGRGAQGDHPVLEFESTRRRDSIAAAPVFTAAALMVLGLTLWVLWGWQAGSPGLRVLVCCFLASVCITHVVGVVLMLRRAECGRGDAYVLRRDRLDLVSKGEVLRSLARDRATAVGITAFGVTISVGGKRLVVLDHIRRTRRAELVNRISALWHIPRARRERLPSVLWIWWKGIILGRRLKSMYPQRRSDARDVLAGLGGRNAPLGGDEAQENGVDRGR